MESMMPLFVTGTGTDVGKTYVTALLCQELKDYLEQNFGSELAALDKYALAYYKAAISGADTLEASDAGYVWRQARLPQPLATTCSYLYREAVSPHLAAARVVAQKGRADLAQSQAAVGEEKLAADSRGLISIETLKQDFLRVCLKSALTVLEGSGGLYCPLRWSTSSSAAAAAAETAAAAVPGGAVPGVLTHQVEQGCFTICDWMRQLRQMMGLKIIVVSDARLGCINNVVTTLQSLKLEGFDLSDTAIILNYYDLSGADAFMYEDNLVMIEAMTKVPVLAALSSGSNRLGLTPNQRQWLTTPDAAFNFHGQQRKAFLARPTLSGH